MAIVPKVGFTQSPELEIDDVRVVGEIPDWVEGTLLRNGPGTFKVGNQRYRHWFDGLAMLHRFSIKSGKVSYSNKFLESLSYSESKQAGRIMYSEFATDPCRSLFTKAMAVFDPKVTDSAKVNIVELAERFYALAETPIQVEFDPQTLKSVGVTGWDSSNFGRMTTVHPHVDHKRNEAFNLVTQFGALSAYSLRRIEIGQELSATKEVASKKSIEPSYIHSFGMSENYLIIVEFPFVVNPISLLLWLKPYIENFKWKPERGTKFHIFDRKNGKLVKTHKTDAFFAFHHVNAFEIDGELKIDLVCYEDNAIINTFYLNRLEDPDMEIPVGRLRRFTVPLTGSEPITQEFIGHSTIELPSFDYAAFNTKSENRFVYGVSVRGGKGFYNQLVKIDIDNNSEEFWFEEGCFPGEAVFIPRPGQDSQDDGVLLSVVLDSAQGTSFLLVLDARNMKEIARACLDHTILFGYHGIFTQY